MALALQSEATITPSPHQLDGHFPIEGLVDGGVDDSHTALTDEALQTITPEAFGPGRRAEQPREQLTLVLAADEGAD
ncbi:MAG: hypothetical protein R6X02_25090 [Enhygromyxa sp.]